MKLHIYRLDVLLSPETYSDKHPDWQTTICGLKVLLRDMVVATEKHAYFAKDHSGHHTCKNCLKGISDLEVINLTNLGE